MLVLFTKLENLKTKFFTVGELPFNEAFSGVAILSLLNQLLGRGIKKKSYEIIPGSTRIAYH